MKFTDEDFNEGITQRESYTHLLYYTALAARLGRDYAESLVSDVRTSADVLYPEKKKRK